MEEKYKLEENLNKALSLSEQKKEVTTRVNRIIGQMQGILRMVDKDEPIEKVMRQIASSNGILHKLAYRLMEYHMNMALQKDAKSEIAEETMAEIRSTLSLYSELL